MHVCPEIRKDRDDLESRLFCGIPNMTTVNDEEFEERRRPTRVKRIVNGIEAKPVSQLPVCSAFKDPGRAPKKTENIGKTIMSCSCSCSSDSDPVAGCSGGEQEDRLWRNFYRRMLGAHCCSLRQVVVTVKHQGDCVEKK